MAENTLSCGCVVDTTKTTVDASGCTRGHKGTP